MLVFPCVPKDLVPNPSGTYAAVPADSESLTDDVLQLIRISSRDRTVNKRTSRKVALHNAQVDQQCGNALGAFIARAMHPSRYIGNERRWMQLRDQLNGVLVIFGYRVNDEGKLAAGAKATPITEAAQLAGELQVELHRRDTHSELFNYCDEEFITKTYFAPRRRRQRVCHNGLSS